MSVKEYEHQEKKLVKKGDLPIRTDFDTFRELEDKSITPILEILTAVHKVYLGKLNQGSNNPIEIISGMLDKRRQEEMTVYEFYKEDILNKIPIPKLSQLRSEIINEVLSYDSEGLHNTILTWMTHEELFFDLEKVDSPYYDKFVAKISAQDRLTKDEIDLVTKYLGKTKKWERLINFLPPIIWDDTSERNSKVRGDYGVKERIIYCDTCQKACKEVLKESEKEQETENIMKGLNRAKTILIIQSNIQSRLIDYKKKVQQPNLRRDYEAAIQLINSRVFDFNDLIEEVTKPMKLYEFTLNIHFNQVIDGEVISQAMINDINDCYCQILDYHQTVEAKTYPACAFERLSKIAKCYYVEDIPTNNKKVPFKR